MMNSRVVARAAVAGALAVATLVGYLYGSTTTSRASAESSTACTSGISAITYVPSSGTSGGHIAYACAGRNWIYST